MVAQSGRAVVLTALPPWPGQSSGAARGRAARNGSLAGPSFAVRHAAVIWREEREAVARRAGKVLGGMTQGERERLGGGIAELEFVSALAEHMARCARCWRASGLLGVDRPADWLLWGIGSRERLREVLEAFLRDSGARGGFGLPRAVEMLRACQSA